jgi:hypothetical protein
MPQPDRGASQALAGFLCGLASFSAALLGSFCAYDLVRGYSSGEGVLLIVGSSPVALAGLRLSIGGRHSISRRWLAIAVAELSALALVPVLVFIVFVVQLYHDCNTPPYGCFA